VRSQHATKNCGAESCVPKARFGWVSELQHVESVVDAVPY
jgi:hypothetical protein